MVKLMPYCVLCKNKASHTGVVKGVHIPLCEIHFIAYEKGIIKKDLLRNLALIQLVRP